MFNKDMYALGSKRSSIRELFEYGKQRAEKVGKENVFDFSLGNPNTPSPDCVKEAILSLADENPVALHGYTSAQGGKGVREAIANNIRRRFGVDANKDFIYMTCGAAASLCITLRALNERSDEFVILAPYFPEYEVFIKAAGGTPIVVPFDEKDFTPNLAALENAITERTKAVIVNSPNNPSGVVYSAETIAKISEILSKKSALFSHPIFIISDEPYRELAYDVEVPYIMNFYHDTIVCYSYSKSLSLPGERIGYIAVNPKANGAKDLYLAICGAGRALGYVCAPSTYQRVVEKCVDALPDLDFYRTNRDLLYNSLTKTGYTCVRPDGAFYLLVKALEDDANVFADNAKRLELLLVPCDDFGAKGYVRIAYCVSLDVIKRSLPAFEKLYNEYKQTN